MSFFDNFKKAIAPEADKKDGEKENEENEKKRGPRKLKVASRKSRKKPTNASNSSEENEDNPYFVQEETEEKPSEKTAPSEEKEEWAETEGQLAIDVFQTDTEVVIQAPIAGVETKDLDISIEKDMITVKGYRPRPEEPLGERSYFYQECYWGTFLRKVILPEDADSNQAEASLKDGILTVRIPKTASKKKKKIIVRE